MTTRFLMNSRKEKAMKAFGMGGHKRGGHITEISIVLGAPKGLKNRGIDKKMPVKKAFGGPATGASLDSDFSLYKPGGTISNFYKKGGRVKKAEGGPFSPLNGLASPNSSTQHLAQTVKPAQPAINKNPWEEVRQGFFGSNPAWQKSLSGVVGLNKGGVARMKPSKKRSRKADGGSMVIRSGRGLTRRADGGPMPTESPEVEQRIEDANQMLKSGMGLKKGGLAKMAPLKKADGGPVRYFSYTGKPRAEPLKSLSPLGKALKKGGRVKKAFGGAMGGSMGGSGPVYGRGATLTPFGSPADYSGMLSINNLNGTGQRPMGGMLLSGFGSNLGSPAPRLKKGGKVNSGRVKKNIGGEIQKAGIMGLPGYFINKATDSYNQGGKVSTVRKADGGSVGLSQMTDRDFNAGKKALGLKIGGDVRMAAGGVGKMRHHQMSKSGKPIKPHSCKY